MLELMTTYENDLGLGFHPTMMQLFTALSACFTLVYLLGGLILWYLLSKKVSAQILKGVTGISVIIFCISFLLMAMLTFLAPIILTGIVLILLTIAYLLNSEKTSSS